MLQGLHLHLDRPAIGSILHVQQFERSSSDHSKRAEIRIGMAVEPLDEAGREPVAKSLLDCERSWLALAQHRDPTTKSAR